MGDRWLHLQAVGRSAEEIRVRGFDVSEAVVMAAWLHDVGYADTVANTGFHPLDGAEWLRQQAAPEGVVALVAYHSAAQYEAEARGLADALARFPAPDQDQMDILTLIDMSTGPTGERVAVNERLAEILERYPTRSALETSNASSRPGQPRPKSPSSRCTPVHATRRTRASLLVALDVHPRVAMTILRHSKIAVTMDIYSQVSSASTKEALIRLGNQFGEEVL
jgi:hypothetical protein